MTPSTVIIVFELVDQTNSIPADRLAPLASDMTLWCEAVLTPTRPVGCGRPSAAVVRAPGADPTPGTWPIYIKPGPAPQGELADHGVSAGDDATPEGHVYIEDCLGGRPMTDPDAWDAFTEALSHEAAEMVGDPWLNRCVESPLGEIWAEEWCDAVQGNGKRYGTGTLFSDVCLPQYFSPSASGNGPWSAHGGLAGPFTRLPGGYYQRLNPATDQWEIPAEHAANLPAWKLNAAHARVNRRNAQRRTAKSIAKSLGIT